MNRRILLFTALTLVFTATKPLLATAQKTQPPTIETSKNEIINPINGKTLRWIWQEGMYGGNSYEAHFQQDGHVSWKITAGPDAGNTATANVYNVQQVANDVFVVSWLQTDGYTVSITINMTTKKIYGAVSARDEWYPVSGTLEGIE